MKSIIILAAALVLILSGCSLNPFSRPAVNDNGGAASGTGEENGKVGMANPASTFCVEHGGQLKIEEDESGGQYGNCVLEDGTVCEEWSYFRGECPAGGSQPLSGNNSVKVAGIRTNDQLTSPVLVKGEAKAAGNQVIIELRNSAHETLVKETANIRSAQPGETGPFQINLNFQFKGTKEGYLAVYEEGQGGSVLNLVEIPVKFTVKTE